MQDPCDTSDGAIAEKVRQILSRSAKEPGLNDMMALLQLTSEAAQVMEACTDLTPDGNITLSSDSRAYSR
jgi:hypothetical protein